MAFPIALPLAPAMGEGLLWGAGLLGSGLATLGIIENKDAISDGVRDFGNWIANGVGNGIRSWSDAMSPKGPVGPNPNYDPATGRPIAVADATRVALPPMGRVSVPASYRFRGGTRRDSDGVETFFPWLSGSPERPIQLRPVIVTGSRVMRTDGDSSQPEPAPASASSEGSGTSAAPANPEPEQDNDGSNNSGNSGNQRRPSLRERVGDRIAGRNAGSSNGGSSSGGATPPDNQQGSFLGRMFWETKNNNFGQNWWLWRNVGRVGLGFSYPAREHLWPAVGQGVKYMTVGPDSVPAEPAAPADTTRRVTAPVDSSYIAPQQVIAPTDTLDF